MFSVFVSTESLQFIHKKSGKKFLIVMFVLVAIDSVWSEVVKTFIMGLSSHNVIAVNRSPIILCSSTSIVIDSMKSKHCI